MSSLEQLETEVEVAEINHDIEMGEALLRLEKNPDFKKIIVDGYLDQKVKSSVSLLAVPNIKQRGERPDIMEDIISASNLQFFLAQIDMFYQAAIEPPLTDEEFTEMEAEEGDSGAVN